MKLKSTIILFLFSITLLGQIERVWEKSFLQSSNPAWLSGTGNTERGFAYGNVAGNERIYVVTRNGSLSIKVLNADDGTEVGSLNTTGISGGTFTLTDVEVSDDGVIFGMNLTTDAAGIVKIYKWVDEQNAPVVVFENNFGAIAKRIGDNFKVVGKANDNSVKIWFVDQTNKKVYVLGTSDGANTFVIENTITLPSNSIDNMSTVYPIDAQSFVMNGNGKNVTKWDMNGNLLGTIPGSQVGTGSNAILYYEINSMPYIATFQHGTTTENARIVMVGNNFDRALTYVSTNSMYQNNNPNGTGDVDIRFNNDGTQTIYVLSTNNGIGAYKISYPFLINGRMNENYSNYHPDTDVNAGFGPDINIDGIFAHLDSEYLYLASDCYLNTASSDGIVLFLGNSKLAGTGVAAGLPLGGVTGGGHLFGDVTNPNFSNDFETHFGFVINSGSAATSVYIDAVKYSNNTKTAQYIGSTTQAGLLGEGPEVDGIFINKSIKFAFYNTHDIRRGWEMKIPLDQIGNPANFDQLQIFAAVVSSTAYFSDVTVPGTIVSGNLGFNPNFSTLQGGPFHMNISSVPVELTSFTAVSSGNNITLNWKTATETNNFGFVIERSNNNTDFYKVGSLSGFGTSTEINSYQFVDENLAAGKYYYRLKQIDFDGTYNYSSKIEVNVESFPAVFELSQNYPNPFNPSTLIKFSVAENGFTNLSIYNALGQKVDELFNQNAEKGNLYQINFDGAKLSSGVYFYSLVQGSLVISKKMMLIK